MYRSNGRQLLSKVCLTNTSVICVSVFGFNALTIGYYYGQYFYLCLFHIFSVVNICFGGNIFLGLLYRQLPCVRYFICEIKYIANSLNFKNPFLLHLFLISNRASSNRNLQIWKFKKTLLFLVYIIKFILLRLRIQARHP